MVEKYGQKWSEEETILAFYLYCQVPFSKITKTNPDIIRLAKILGRTPSSVGLKMANLAHFDPELRRRNRTGMSNASKLDEAVANRFCDNWEELTFVAKQIEAQLTGKDIEEIIPQTVIDLPEGLTVPQTIQARVNQQFFPRPGGKFCVSVFRQNQEYHVINVHDGAYSPWLQLSRKVGTVCAPIRRECRHSLPGILIQGDQPALRSANMISNWLSTMSQFWHRACQCFTIRWDARYSIRRRESSLVKEGLFLVICRN